MVVDLLEKNGVNIKDLTLPEVGRYEWFNFNPKKDLTSSDWQWMLNGFDEARKESRDKPYELGLLYLGSSIKVIDPGKHPERLIHEDEWEAIKNHIRTEYGESWYLFAEHAACLKLLDRNRLAEIQFPEKDYLSIEQKLREDLLKKDNGSLPPNHIGFIELASNLRILRPNFPIPENEKIWEKALQCLDSYGNQSDCHVLSEILAEIRIIFPGQFSELHIKKGIIDGIQRGFQEVYSKKKSKEESRFAHSVMNLQILSAKDIQVTDQGIEITMPDLNIDEKPNLPGVRKF